MTVSIFKKNPDPFKRKIFFSQFRTHLRPLIGSSTLYFSKAWKIKIILKENEYTQWGSINASNIIPNSTTNNKYIRNFK